MSEKPIPRLPRVGEIVRSVGELVEIRTPPPVQPPPVYVFREKCFDLKVMNGNVEIERTTCFNNLYADTEKSLVDDIRKLERYPKWNIPASGFSVVVEEVIEEFEVSPTPTTRENFYDPIFLHIDSHKQRHREVSRREIYRTGMDAPLPSTAIRWWEQPHWTHRAGAK